MLMILALAALMSGTPSQAADRRMAMVVGVGDYPGNAQLRNPANDATLIADALKKNGFEIATPLIDPDKRSFEKALADFVAKAGDAVSAGDDVTLFFYYSGHGIAVPGNYGIEQYLIPRGTDIFDATIKDEYSFDGAVRAAAVRGRLATTSAARIVIVFDACRTPPISFGTKAQPASGLQTLPALRASSDILLVYASEPGTPALDSAGPDGANVFARNLADALSKEPTIFDVFRAVRASVFLDTQRRQRPTMEGSVDYMLSKDRYIKKLEQEVASPPGSRVPIGTPAPASSVSGTSARIARQPPAASFPDGMVEMRQAIARDGIASLQRRAAENDGVAEYLLGLAYSSGHMVAKDPKRASELFQSAIADGELRATNSLGYMFFYGELGPKNVAEAARWWEIGRGRGVAGAINNIGTLYQSGETGYPKDVHKAAALFRDAAAKGYPLAMVNLAGLLRGDDLGERDPAGAIQLLTRAGESGRADAWRTLSYMAQVGEGRPVDQALANDYFRRAAAADDALSAYDLSGRLFSGIGGPVDVPSAVTMLRRAADLGNIEAASELGRRLRDGADMPADMAEALRWLRKAAGTGDVRGRLQLAKTLVGSEGNAGDVAEGEQILGAIVAEEQKGPKPDVWPMDYYNAGIELVKFAGARGMTSAGGYSVAELRTRYGSAHGMKRFTVPIECFAVGTTGAKTPFDVYLFDWERPTDMVASQLDWVEKQRGCRVPKDVPDAFAKLYTIARENKVSYMELSVYALNESSKTAPPAK